MRTPVPEEEPEEEKKEEEKEEEKPEEEEEKSKSLVRARSHRAKASGERAHHHHHHEGGEGKKRRRKILKSKEPEPPKEEDVLGNFGVEKEVEAISDSESEEDVPGYTFAAPISRLSRSPTPMGRRTVVAMPGRSFVPQKKKIEAISDSSDDEPAFTSRSSVIGLRSFASVNTGRSSYTPASSGVAWAMEGCVMNRGRTFSSKPFGADRASTFARSNSTVAAKSRNVAMIDSDSDEDMPVGRASFAPRTSFAPRASMAGSTAGRPSMGRFVSDDGDDRRRSMMGIDRYRKM